MKPYIQKRYRQPIKYNIGKDDQDEPIVKKVVRTANKAKRKLQQVAYKTGIADKQSVKRMISDLKEFGILPSGEDGQNLGIIAPAISGSIRNGWIPRNPQQMRVITDNMITAAKPYLSGASKTPNTLTKEFRNRFGDLFYGDEISDQQINAIIAGRRTAAKKAMGKTAQYDSSTKRLNIVENGKVKTRSSIENEDGHLITDYVEGRPGTHGNIQDQLSALQDLASQRGVAAYTGEDWIAGPVHMANAERLGFKQIGNYGRHENASLVPENAKRVIVHNSKSAKKANDLGYHYVYPEAPVYQVTKNASNIYTKDINLVDPRIITADGKIPYFSQNRGLYRAAVPIGAAYWASQYNDGKTIIGSNVRMNDDGTFTDDYTRAFDDLTITPNGPRVKPGQLYKYQEPWNDEKFVNAITLGGLNNLSPAQWIRRGYDLATGNLTTDSWLNGNSGIVPDSYAKEHPLMSIAANGLVDFWTLGGSKLLKSALSTGTKLNPAQFTKYEPQPVQEPLIKPQPVPKQFEIEEIPGYQLKSLMRGNALEKQLSKQGTISVNSIRAHANKASEVEKSVIDKILSSEEFVGQKSIDYNKFRKAVHNNLITYDRIPDARYEDFGISRLGFEEPTSIDRANRLWQKAYDEAKQLHPDWSERELVDFTNDVMGPIRHPVKLNTYTFESNKIPHGSAKHYDSSTLGHSRTYTTQEEPDILHVMESQSDWGQNTYFEISPGQLKGPIGYFTDGSAINMETNEIYSSEILDQLFKQVNAQPKHLHDNYIFRQIQENLKYAAEHGQTKMRYPTPDTAAKIEGYQKNYGNVREMTEDELEELNRLREKVRILGQSRPRVTRRNSLDENGNVISQPRIERDTWDAQNPEFVEAHDRYMDIQNRIVDNQNGKIMIIDSSTSDYRPEHKTILKKYADFPKQFKKLHKNAEVREVTDEKGNTWYEVDVPKDFLNKEWMYGIGAGLVGGAASINYDWGIPGFKNGKNPGIYIKPSHRGRFTALKKRTGHSTAWFKAHGTPAQKKMAVFAQNARKWKH